MSFPNTNLTPQTPHTRPVSFEKPGSVATHYGQNADSSLTAAGSSSGGQNCFWNAVETIKNAFISAWEWVKSWFCGSGSSSGASSTTATNTTATAITTATTTTTTTATTRTASQVKTGPAAAGGAMEALEQRVNFCVHELANCCFQQFPELDQKSGDYYALIAFICAFQYSTYKVSRNEDRNIHIVNGRVVVGGSDAFSPLVLTAKDKTARGGEITVHIHLGAKNKQTAPTEWIFYSLSKKCILDAAGNVTTQQETLSNSTLQQVVRYNKGEANHFLNCMVNSFYGPSAIGHFRNQLGLTS